MSLARRTVEEYTALLSRAFNGAIEVNGQRIVAHPSGTLLNRTRNPAPAQQIASPGSAGARSEANAERRSIVWPPAVAPATDKDNDWSDI